MVSEALETIVGMLRSAGPIEGEACRRCARPWRPAGLPPPRFPRA